MRERKQCKGIAFSVAALFCGLSIGWPGIVLAQTQWTPDGVEVAEPLTDTIVGAIASDGQGGAFIAYGLYPYEETTAEADIKVCRFDHQGRKLWETVIAATPGEREFQPSIAEDGFGGVVVVWLHANSGYYEWVLRGQRVNGNGQIRWEEGGVLITPYPADPVGYYSYRPIPSPVISDGTGGLIVAWVDERNPSLDIYVQRVLNDGTLPPRWPTGGAIVGVTPVDDLYPDICSDNEGGAIISWYSYEYPEFADIWAQRVDPADGHPVWPEDAEICVNVPSLQKRPRTVVDGQGGAIVAWVDHRGPGIYAQRVNSVGATQWQLNGICVTEDILHLQQERFSRPNTPIAADGDHGAIIAWMHYDPASSECDIYAERLNSGGEGQWTPEVGGLPVCTAPGWQYDPNVVSDNSGGAVIVWTDSRFGEGQYDIYAQHMSSSGSARWIENGKEVTSSHTAWCLWYQGAGPLISKDEEGGALCIWPNRPTETEFSVYMQGLNDRSLTRSELATAYNGGRKLVRVPNTDDLWLAYQSTDVIYVRSSTDGGKNFQTQYMNYGGFPTIALTPPSPQGPTIPPIPVVVWIPPESNPVAGDIMCARFYAGNWQTCVLHNDPTHTPYLPSMVIDSDIGRAHVAWESVASDNVRHLNYAMFDADDPAWPPTVYEDLDIDNFTGASYMSPSIDLDDVGPIIGRPHIVYRKGEDLAARIYYAVKNEIWELSLISQVDKISSFPFLEVWGDSAQALWAGCDPSGADDIWYRARCLWRLYWEQWWPVSGTSPQSQFPCMAADYASWSEENYEGADWEIVMREKPFTGPIHNISNTDARSMYSQTNYWQRDEDPRFLYIAWTEGDGNRFAREVRALEYPLNHPPVPHYYVETGQEEPSFYCLERDSFLQFGPEPYQQVDIHADQLIYRLPGLMPWLRYRLVVTGYWEGEDEVREQLDIDGLDQRLMRLTPGVPETLAVWISPAAYKEDRSVDVNLTLVTGEWAVTGPMVLYEFERDEDGGDGGAQSAPATRCEPEPEAFTLSQSYPNPVHSHATIGFHISASTSLSLKIYDTSGRLVRTLVDNPVPAGHHKVTWDTTDDAGMAVGNGVYFYRLSATPQGGSASGGEAGNLVRANKMVVLR